LPHQGANFPGAFPAHDIRYDHRPPKRLEQVQFVSASQADQRAGLGDNQRHRPLFSAVRAVGKIDRGFVERRPSGAIGAGDTMKRRVGQSSGFSPDRLVAFAR